MNGGKANPIPGSDDDAESAGNDWHGWLARHGPALLLYARQWAPVRADAEDVVQEGFVRFWRSRGRAADPVAYVYACVRTCALEAIRGRQRRDRRERVVAEARGPRDDWFEVSAVDADRSAELETALGALPDAQREVVVLKVWGGLSFGQIAAASGVSPDTAASRYRYAIDKLRRRLAPREAAI